MQLISDHCHTRLPWSTTVLYNICLTPLFSDSTLLHYGCQQSGVDANISDSVRTCGAGQEFVYPPQHTVQSLTAETFAITSKRQVQIRQPK